MYSFDQLQLFIEVDKNFYVYDDYQLIINLKLLPRELRDKIIYAKIADFLQNFTESKKITLSKVMIEFKIDPSKITSDTFYNQIDSNLLEIEKSMNLILKAAELEDGAIDHLDVTEEEYQFIKEDFIRREKYELISKLVII